MADPNQKITQMITANSKSDAESWRANIVNTFLSFGYQPTETEVAQLIPTAEGTGGYERGQASVAQYVQTKKAEEERQANDPLKKFVDDMTKRANDLQTQSQELYGQLQDTLNQAPKLFGNLAPDQIDAYIKPLQNLYDQMGAKLEGDFARRGAAGSSIEAGAMTDSNKKFKEDVLSQGLQVGLQQQQTKASSIQDRLNQLFGGANSTFSMAGTGSGQLSSQGLDTSRYLSSLPYFLQQSALQQQVLQKQLNSNPSLWDNIERGIGDASSFASIVLPNGANGVATKAASSGSPTAGLPANPSTGIFAA